ncbi:hypothetical protein B4U80_13968 [Leptotrombidium deliense]|uniref:Peptidase S1 domain-containing protein n=1 Tax=Leptotrombidium deliense TaxID=299467 RepID=A0A443S670_9ACAR|nr:hypothetical protein B4U80_13968 [Leptotrombidium deliense]
MNYQSNLKLAYYTDFDTFINKFPIRAKKFVETEMQFVLMEMCSKYYYPRFFLSFPYDLDSKIHFCAIKETEDISPSGSVLMADNNGKLSAIGLMSFAMKKNKTDSFINNVTPFVFTKVENYISWIKENTLDGQYCDN